MHTATILTVTATVAVLLTPVLAAWFSSRVQRKTASGSVATSSAESLWQAANALIASYQAENGKLISQRDRLVEAFERMLPVQEHNSQMLTQLLDMASGFRQVGPRQEAALDLLAANAERMEVICERLNRLLGGDDVADPDTGAGAAAAQAPRQPTSPPGTQHGG